VHSKILKKRRQFKKY